MNEEILMREGLVTIETDANGLPAFNIMNANDERTGSVAEFLTKYVGTEALLLVVPHPKIVCFCGHWLIEHVRDLDDSPSLGGCTVQDNDRDECPCCWFTGEYNDEDKKRTCKNCRGINFWTGPDDKIHQRDEFCRAVPWLRARGKMP